MSTDRPAPLTTGRLLQVRARSRTGLLVAMAASVATAVATVTVLGLWIVQAVAAAADARPAGLGDESFAAQVDDGVAALLATTPGLVLLVVLLAAVAAAQLGRLVAAARVRETAALRARGLSRRQARAADAVEAALVVVAGFVAGVVLAAGAFALLGVARGRGGIVLGRAESGAAVGVAAAVAVLLGVIGLLAAGRIERGGERAGRAGRATTAVLVVVVLATAAFVVWQLQTVRERPGAFDPVVAVAPAAVLLAASIVVLAAFAPLTAAAAVAAARPPALAPALPARQVSRRVPVYAVAVLLIAFTSAQAVFAAGYASTWQALVGASTAVQTGTDLRVDLGTTAATPELVATAGAVPGVEDVSSALLAPVEAGANEFELIAVPGPQIDRVLAPVQGAVDPGSLAAAVAVPSAAVPLGESATGLEVRATVTSTRPDGAAAVQLSAWVTDARGTASRLRLETAPNGEVDGVPELSGVAALPEGTGPWSLIAVVAGLDTFAAPAGVTVTLTGIDATGGDAVDADGSVELTQGESEQWLWLADPAEDAADPPPVPIVVSTALAARAGLGIGDVLDIRYSGSGREGALQVADVVASIPGASTPLAAFTALDVLQASMLQRGSSLVAANAIWASGDPAAAAAVSEQLGGRVVLTSSPGVPAVIAGALVPAWWIATAGAVVLALVALAAIGRALSSGRAAELAVLRTHGVTARVQSRMRMAELAGVAVFALVAGAAVGALAAGIAAPSLAGAAAPGIRSLAPAGVSFAVMPLAAVLAVLAVGLAGVVLVTGAAVRRSAHAAVVTEGAR